MDEEEGKKEAKKVRGKEGEEVEKEKVEEDIAKLELLFN